MKTSRDITDENVLEEIASASDHETNEGSVWSFLGKRLRAVFSGQDSENDLPAKKKQRVSRSSASLMGNGSKVDCVSSEEDVDSSSGSSTGAKSTSRGSTSSASSVQVRIGQFPKSQPAPYFFLQPGTGMAFPSFIPSVHATSHYAAFANQSSFGAPAAFASYGKHGVPFFERESASSGGAAEGELW